MCGAAANSENSRRLYEVASESLVSTLAQDQAVQRTE